MKYLIALTFVAGSIGCATSPQPVQQNSNTTRPERSHTVVAHSTENQTPPSTSGDKTKWSQSGDPIDTKSFDDAIKTAEKALAGKANDPAAKKALAEAYLKRGVALTEARQYASALGDYRRTIKYDADNKEAKEWIDKIVMIYDGMNKSYPKDGEEPPPLPFTKK